MSDPRAQSAHQLSPVHYSTVAAGNLKPSGRKMIGRLGAYFNP